MINKCPTCGKFMHLSDVMPIDDEFDDELAFECGYTEDDIDNLPYEDLWKFHYIQDQWECGGCFYSEWHTEGLKYYFDPERNNYYLDAKPLTPNEKLILENKMQEENGQLRLFE